MANITREFLAKKVCSIEEKTGAELWLEISGAPARPALVMQTGDGITQISPRLSTSKLYEWLDAFEKGYDFNDFRRNISATAKRIGG